MNFAPHASHYALRCAHAKRGAVLATAAPTFAPPRRVREQMAGWHWFVGTGPWGLWELLLLWLDSFVLLGFVCNRIAKRFCDP
jgi:hypothetical protein